MSGPLLQRARYPELRRLLSLLFCLVLSVLSASSAEPSATNGSVKEPELRAAYIYNFAKFTTWADARTPAAPLVIGVLGDDAIASSLTVLTKGRAINGSVIEVRSFTSGSIPADLQIAYVAASQDQSLPQLAPTLFVTGRLTIGETQAFLQAGGIVRLFVDSDRLQFEIDKDHAQRARLTLSSQLLMLAKKVKTTEVP